MVSRVLSPWRFGARRSGQHGTVESVPLARRSTDRLREVLDEEDHARVVASLSELRRVLTGRRVWHVNSTRSGGGVAELLAGLLPYACGAGVDVHWLVVEGNELFFDVTKRLHHRLHDRPGDGGALSDAERSVYERTLEPEADRLVGMTQPGDVAVLHDPQTAGLAPLLRRHGVHVVWRCHVGVDDPGALARTAWDFLGRDVAAAEGLVFSRASYVWDELDEQRVTVMAPCIDVLATKNDRLRPGAGDAILRASGLVPHADGTGPPVFRRADGSSSTVRRRVTLVEDRPLPVGAAVVTQVSRWDPLKDPVGVLRAFATTASAHDSAELVLAGPDAAGVADDPEAEEIFAAVVAARADLDPKVRSRTHLASIPMDDVEENAAIVNALQSRSDVIVQKSLAEGFGLTVAEAMWKRRPVVASRVGGIQDQIIDGESGVLLDDPGDLESAGRAVAAVLRDGERADRLATAAHRRICDSYLASQHFAAEAALFERVVG